MAGPHCLAFLAGADREPGMCTRRHLAAVQALGAVAPIEAAPSAEADEQAEADEGVEPLEFARAGRGGWGFGGFGFRTIQTRVSV